MCMISEFHFVRLPKQVSIERGIPYYFTGKACKHGHLSNRKVSNNHCVECHRAHSQLKRDTTPGYAPALARKYRYSNYARSITKERQYRSTNFQRISVYQAEYRRSEIGKVKFRVSNAKRRAAKNQATPAWADHERINQIYLDASRLEAEYRIKLAVDHYFPLRGKTVCGLHVPENLVVITKAENLAKKDKHPEDWEKEKALLGLSFPTLRSS